ncbi:hypothetical protein BD413DRAFT_3894 [Trametes elegans]|nr:hypothetical protein BD413DRAFT_3894 [Trametes elegans]
MNPYVRATHTCVTRGQLTGVPGSHAHANLHPPRSRISSSGPQGEGAVGGIRLRARSTEAPSAMQTNPPAVPHAHAGRQEPPPSPRAQESVALALRLAGVR